MSKPEPNCGNCFFWLVTDRHSICRHRTIVHAVHFGRLSGYPAREAGDVCASHPAFGPHRMEDGRYYPDDAAILAEGKR